MSLISSKIILTPQASTTAFGAPGSAYTALQQQVFAGAGNFVLPPGDWWVVPNADISVEYCATGNGAFVSLGVVSQLTFVRSDGANFQLTASAATTADYFGPA